MGRAAIHLTLIAGLAAGSVTLGQAASPYGGFQDRAIKAVSNEEIDALRQGQGLSMALAAELNGYPGPRHVLDLGDDLELTAEQREALEPMFREMRARAMALGNEVLALEADLDRLFLDGNAVPERTRDLVTRIAELRGRLRYTHLHYHLETKALLTPAQVRKYAHLRGYSGDHGAHQHRH